MSAQSRLTLTVNLDRQLPFDGPLPRSGCSSSFLRSICELPLLVGPTAPYPAMLDGS